MKVKEPQYIAWHNDPHWVANIALGSRNLPYQFKADWNNRDESWAVTIRQDEMIIIQGVRLVLNVNILAMAASRKTPDCILCAATWNRNIERISFDNMINHEVKLYHILPEG